MRLFRTRASAELRQIAAGYPRSLTGRQKSGISSSRHKLILPWETNSWKSYEEKDEEEEPATDGGKNTLNYD